MIGVSMLDGGLERSSEWYGSVEMKTVDARPAARQFRAHDRRAIELIGEGLAAEIPRAQEIIFRPGARNGRGRVIIDEEHVIPFAPPTILVLHHRHSDAYKLPAPPRFHPDVVVLAVQVSLVIDQRIAIGCPVVSPPMIRLGLAILGMEIQRSAGQRMGVGLVVD